MLWASCIVTSGFVNLLQILPARIFVTFTITRVTIHACYLYRGYGLKKKIRLFKIFLLFCMIFEIVLKYCTFFLFPHLSTFPESIVATSFQRMAMENNPRTKRNIWWVNFCSHIFLRKKFQDTLFCSLSVSLCEYLLNWLIQGFHGYYCYVIRT